MKTYKIIQHTADIGLLINASTLGDLFQTALEGLANIASPHACPKELPAVFEVKIEASDCTALLIDFLSHVLTKMQITKHVYCQATFVSLTDTGVHAVIRGHKVDKFSEDIKAVTYHGALITQNNGIFQISIIFDI